MTQIYHKRGDTLSLTCTWTSGETSTPIDLTNYTIACQVRAVGFSDDITVAITSAVDGQFTLSASASATSKWPLTDSSASRLFCDVQFTSTSAVISSETFQIIVLEDITQ